MTNTQLLKIIKAALDMLPDGLYFDVPEPLYKDETRGVKSC